MKHNFSIFLLITIVLSYYAADARAEDLPDFYIEKLTFANDGELSFTWGNKGKGKVAAPVVDVYYE